MLVLPPGASHHHDVIEWSDRLVIVERGVIELLDENGVRCRFGRGAVLCLVMPNLRSIANPGRKAAVLSLIARHPNSFLRSRV